MRLIFTMVVLWYALEWGAAGAVVEMERNLVTPLFERIAGALP